MIIINTEDLLSVVSIMEDACNQIDSALINIEKVRSHKNWTCREKSALDKYMQSNIKRIKKLQQDSYAFLNTLKQVSKDMDEGERDILQVLQQMEDVIKKSIAVLPSSTIQNEHIAGLIGELKIEGLSDNISDLLIAPFPNIS